MPGLVFNGESVEVAGVKIVNFLDDDSLTLADHSYAQRHEAIKHIVLHTTKGFPDHEFEKPQSVREDAAESKHCTARKTVEYWRSGHRIAGAHAIIDADGTVCCLADIMTASVYHCVDFNQISVGIEITQQGDASLFRRQIDVVSVLVEALTTRLSLPRTVALPYRGRRDAVDGVTVLGHRDCSKNRGFGDPGDFVMEAALQSGGWTTVP